MKEKQTFTKKERVEINIDSKEVDAENLPATCCKKCFLFLRIYKKTFLGVLGPFCFLPILIVYSNSRPLRFLYVAIIMGWFWALQAMPLAITALVPVVLFPALGIMEVEKVCATYANNAVLFYIGTMILTLAVEYSQLHKRLALRALSLIGISMRRLHIGVVLLTTLVSMWISNTGTTAMVIPIVKALLEELSAQGLIELYDANLPNTSQSVFSIADSKRRVTRLCTVFYCSVCFSATIGGTATLIGSITNTILKGIYEAQYQHDTPHDVSFTNYSLFTLPLLIFMITSSVFSLQIQYLGLFRPKSKTALQIKFSPQAVRLVENILAKRIEEMGPISCQEITVAVIFFLYVLLLFFRNPGFMPGLGDLFKKNFDVTLKESTVAIFIVILIFSLPSAYTCLKFCKKLPKRQLPKSASRPILPWKFVHERMPWGVVLLIGGGFALAAGAKETELEQLMKSVLSKNVQASRYSILIAFTALLSIIAELVSNVANLNVCIPIVATVAKAMSIDPLFLILHCGLSACFSFLSPIGAPANMLVAAYSGVTPLQMMECGITVKIWCYFWLVTLGPQVFDLVFPTV